MPTPPPLPQRPTIPASLLADTTQTVTIPLHLCPLAGPSGLDVPTPAPAVAGYKLGIKLQLACNNIKSPPELYEFDTGGQGFWAAPTGGIPTPAAADCTLRIKYASNIVYKAAPTTATITFAEANAPLQTQATIGLIGEIEHRKFPIFGYFQGDFGAALQGFSQTDGAPPSLFTALAQLPGNYGNGFIVDAGPYPGLTPQATLPPGQLIVGLTSGLRQFFPNTVPMKKYLPYTSAVTSTPLQTYHEDVISGRLSVGALPAVNAGIVFDTGAPSTVLHAGTVVTPAYQPNPGDQILLTPPNSNSYSLLSFVDGGESGLNQAQFTHTDVLHLRDGYINTGLTAFFQYPIMFDLANGVIGFPTP